MLIASFLRDTETQVLASLLAAALLGAAVSFHRWLKKHVAEPLTAVPGIVALQQEQERQLRDLKLEVKAISEQVHANHGTSLRDSANRNEVLTRELAKFVGVDPDSLVPPMPPAEAEPV